MEEIKQEQEQQVQQEQKTIEQVEEKLYSQKQYDNAIAVAKRKVAEKYEKQYVKRPAIEKALLDKGCKKEAINDFISLNQDIMECETDKIQDYIANKTEQFKYMFQEDKEFVADPLSQFQVNSDKEQEENIKSYTSMFGK